MRRPLFLTGFMGTGKTTIGREVASRAGVPFLDLDEEIVRGAGRSIAELFRAEGEAAFRSLERAEVERALDDTSPRVVALGGGALLSRPIRLRALSSGTVVSLKTDAAVLLDRLNADTSRPVLEGARSAAGLAELLVSRENGYAEAHARIDTSASDVAHAAASALAVWAREPLVVALGSRTYPVDVLEGDEALARAIDAANPTGVLLVSDRNVLAYAGERLRSLLGARLVGTYVLEPGERSKSIEGLLGGWLAARQAGLDRRALVLGVGGGVVTDLAGMLASTWLRGIRWIAMPTSVLATVDAAIGGKTGIDFGAAKNAVGTFHQPIAVCANVSLLATEPRRSLCAGLAEVAKAALVGDETLLSLLERDADHLLNGDSVALVPCLRAGAAVKTAIVSRDEREGGDRALLNFGHTFGHALEAAGGFGRWLHGEAVSLGMVAELRAGASLGLTPASLVDRVTVLLDRLGLPTQLRRRDIEEALPFVVLDKKREGENVRFVVVASPGKATLRNIALLDLERLFLGAAR